jgi:hypothetical protein
MAERPSATLLEVVREIHGGHAAGTELALHAIAVGQGGVRRAMMVVIDSIRSTTRPAAS